jgi:hypothetical protein
MDKYLKKALKMVSKWKIEAMSVEGKAHKSVAQRRLERRRLCWNAAARRGGRSDAMQRDSVACGCAGGRGWNEVVGTEQKRGRRCKGWMCLDTLSFLKVFRNRESLNE